MRKIEKRSDCPISYSLDILGDKWTLLILRDMLFNSKQYYKEFLSAGEGIATNVLSDRLKMLETFGIIVSRQDEALRTRKIYSLTEKGKSLIPVIVELWIWGAKNDPGSGVSETEFNKRMSRKQETIKYLMDTIQVAE